MPRERSNTDTTQHTSIDRPESGQRCAGRRRHARARLGNAVQSVDAQPSGGLPPAGGATLTLTRFLNATAYADLPPLAIEHAKMILASTLSSAAVGITMDSARIQRDLALDQGGEAESTVWFDGTKLPAVLAARVNAAASDAAAPTTATCATSRTSAPR